MKKTTMLTAALLGCALQASARPYEKGPYTVTRLEEDVYNIVDANRQNPAGMHNNKTGEVTGMNNSSDMYLVLGTEKALLIDLSNNIDWYEDPAGRLQEIVYDLARSRQLVITLTHRHGDHLGMLPAFRDDSLVRFWVPENDFSGSELFPDQRTVFFKEKESLDLGGGVIVDSFSLPGHTPGSTLFFLRGRHLVFTGDALGSGNGLWLLNEESFGQLSASFGSLMKHILDPSNGISHARLVLYTGHSWQKGTSGPLGSNYLEDMQVLIGQIGSGTALTEPYQTFLPFLNANFRYQSATITWNREAAERFVEEKRFPPERDFTGQGPTHRGNNFELIKLLDSHNFTLDDSPVGDMEYYLYDPVAHGADPGKKYPLIVMLHGASNGMEGVMCAAYTDFVVYAGEEYQQKIGGAYILFPKANEYVQMEGDNQVILGTWMTRDATQEGSVYTSVLAALLEDVISAHNIDEERVVIGGTSAGGYMVWRFLAARPDLVKGAFLIAPADNPSEEELKTYEKHGIHIWVIHGKKDEICPFGVFTGPVRNMLEATKNVRVSALETVRYGDKGIVRLNVRGTELGQHLPLFCVGSDMIYDDGTPYDPRYPEGFTGWLNMVFGND